MNTFTGHRLKEGAGGFARWAFVVFLTAGAVWFISMVWSIIPPFLLALVITYLLDPPVRFFEQKGFKRLYSILAVYGILVGITALALIFLVPALISEIDRLAEALPRYTRQIQQIGRAIELAPERAPMPESIRLALNRAIDRFEINGVAALNNLVAGIFAAFSSAVSLFLAPVLAFYFLLDLEKIKSGFVRLIPAAIRREVLALIGEIDIVLGGFVRGQLTLALIIGVLVTVALSLLGLRYVVVFGLFAGIMELIPYFGPVIGGIPPVVLGALKSPWLGLKVALAVILIQQIESVVIVPRVMGKNVGLHPLIVIFSLMAGGYLWGFWGLLLAVPAAAVLRVIIGFCYERLIP